MDNGNIDDIWELVGYATRESFALRSFLEWLNLPNVSSSLKAEKLKEWRKHVGLSLGNPLLEDKAAALNGLRELPPETRKEQIRLLLERANRIYYGDIPPPPPLV